MEQFLNDFGKYCTEASYGSFWFWGIPIVTVIGIWLLTTIGLKIFRSRKKLKTAFLVNKAWIICSLIAAFVIIAIICYCWSQNIFAATSKDYRLSWLMALTIALIIPIIAFLNLRRYYNVNGIKEVTDQPITKLQYEASVPLLKRSYERIKWYYIIPAVAFLFLLFYLNKGTNLISIVFDNSGSMNTTNAESALSETFKSLEENNEIVLATLEGLSAPDDVEGKKNMNELMLVTQSAKLKAGKITQFNTPTEAYSNLSSVLNTGVTVYGSPICEAIWKIRLFIKETKANQEYKNRLLIVITDGQDNIDATLNSGKFFFDNAEFSEYFAPENTFILDYSGGNSTNFMQRAISAGCDVYPVENNKADYLDALDNALQSFKNNWNLIFWTFFTVALFTIIALLIPPKKII